MKPGRMKMYIEISCINFGMKHLLELKNHVA